MKRIIVAIGGGKNGRLLENGQKDPYETAPMDKEIIKLTSKKYPHFLFIAHSIPLEGQEFYFNTMKNIYNGLYGCECRDIKSNELNNKEKIQALIEWADIIYEGGGNTLDMIKLWQETKFDLILREAWNKGKVMCGVSAGANCWFKECSSDSLQIKYGKDKPLIKVKCLNLSEGLFVPHCDAPGRLENVKELLKNSEEVGIAVSNCAALEIIDDKYRIITSDASNYNIKPFVQKSFWKNSKYYQELLDTKANFRPLNDLFSKEEK